LQSAAATPTESTSTATTISEDVSVTTLAPELQTPSESGSIGWWLLGGSFTISLWWIILARRRREDSPIAEGSED
jgi:carbohydrate-binding DOMON domain-containing protein